MDRELKKKYQVKIDALNKRADIQRIIWDGTFPNLISKNYKISLCTTCMGRLHDLKMSLPKNMEDNADYPNVEYVILDYNSKDGVGDWIKENYMPEIESGKIVYGRAEEPEFYSMTKSRNLSFNLASGDIVNNIDADCYTTAGFATRINLLANQKTEKAIFAKGKQLLRGRVGFWKKEFNEDLGGYDEDIEDYGFDEWDIMNRAWKLGFMLMHFGGRYYGSTGSPKHDTSNMKEKDHKFTEMRNKILSYRKIIKKQFKANQQPDYRAQTVIKNFGK